MDNLSSMFIDLIVIIFNLVIFIQATGLGNDSATKRIVLYIGSGIIMLVYFLTSYMWNISQAIATTVYLTLPSLILYYWISRFKDARFFLTFCLVETLSTVVVSYGRTLVSFTSSAGPVMAPAVILIIYLAICAFCRPYFRQYAQLLESVDEGWNLMMVASILIYTVLFFAVSYLEPLLELPDYLLVYAAFTLVIVACYGVFISSIIKTKKIYEQNRRLQEEKRFYHIAYTDSLTGIPNRAAYEKKINSLQRARKPGDQIWVVVLDMNDFKSVNDNFGHQTGDAVLQSSATLLSKVFWNRAMSIFRIGGDEFVVIAEGIPESLIAEKLHTLEELFRERNADGNNFCSFSFGYAATTDVKDSIEDVFSRADQKMYEQKRRQRKMFQTRP